MRILQVVHRYRPRIGGMENYVYNLQACLRELGHRVDVLTTDYKIPRLARKEPNAFYSRTMMAPMDNPFSLDLVTQLHARADYDVYHLHSAWFLTTWVASRMLPKSKIVLTSHVTKPWQTQSRRLAYNITKPIITRVFRKCKVIICLTEKDKQAISNEFKIPRAKIRVIPNGIPMGLTRLCTRDKEELCKQLGLIPESFKLLYVGRLHREKNVDLLISVADMLPSNIELIIAGSGESVDYIKTLRKLVAKIHHPVHLFLDMPFDILTCLYKYSDLFVTLGEVEGLPTTILEAMAFGLPIISYGIGGVSEIVAKGGLVLDRLDGKLLRDTILSFYNNESFSKKTREQNLSKIRRFQWPTITKQIEQIYYEVTGR